LIYIVSDNNNEYYEIVKGYINWWALIV
jgi:hypothetical protein